MSPSYSRVRRALVWVLAFCAISTGLAAVGVAATATAAPPSGTARAGQLEVTGRLAESRVYLDSGREVEGWTLKSPSGTYQLQGDPTEFASRARSGVRVAATGTLRGKATLQLSGLDVLAATATPHRSKAPVAKADPTPDDGHLRVLVIPTKFGSPGLGQLTPEFTNQLVGMSRELKSWYRATSYGKLTIDTDFAPWVSVKGSRSPSCLYDGQSLLMPGAKDALKDTYQLADYDAFIIYMPRNLDCTYNGALIEGWAPDGVNLYLNGKTASPVVVHEFGHTLGLWHANTVDCPVPLVPDPSCSLPVYGNKFDSMGTEAGDSRLGSFNASAKNQLGWMDGKVVNLSNGGQVRIEPLSFDDPTRAAVLVTTTSPLGLPREYWLEYRQPSGVDYWLPTRATNGVMVHVVQPLEAWRQYGPVGADFAWNGQLVATRPNDGADRYTVKPGQPWTTPEGITISVSTATNNGATVSVEVPQNTLSASVAGTGKGRVVSQPAGIDCSNTCTTRVNRGSQVTLSVTPDELSDFVRWEGDCTGTTPTCTVSMTADRQVRAVVDAAPLLAVSIGGTGSGSVSSDPAGLGCRSGISPCVNPVHGPARQIRLDATANPGSEFVRWEGACSGTSPTCTVVSSQSRDVTAIFQSIPMGPVTVYVFGSGKGQVESPSTGIQCQRAQVTCKGSGRLGQQVSFQATAEPGSEFVRWLGVCATTVGPVCTVPMVSGLEVWADFEPVPALQLSVSWSGDGQGSVRSDPVGIDCAAPSVCSGSFPRGTSVTLTASPKDGSVFAGWTGACSGTATSCTVTVDQAGEVTAAFTKSGTPPPGCTITGTDQGETLEGTPRADVICGLGGDDTVRGYGKDDILRGGAGRDLMVGGAGIDTCEGNTAEDRVKTCEVGLVGKARLRR